MHPFHIRPARPEETDWLMTLFKGFGAPIVIVAGQFRDLRTTPSLIAELENERVGALAYRWDGSDLVEALVLQVVKHRSGVGSALMQALFDVARRGGAKRTRIHTTNDNVPAQRLHVSVGATLVHQDIGGFAKILRMMGHDPNKTQMIGQNGQPITDILRYEKRLTDN